jgi:hypothetical protein
LVLSLLAIICGADSFVAIELYGQCQKDLGAAPLERS